MPYTAKCVMNHYCSVGRFNDKLYVCITNEEGAEFVELPEA
jgi:8-oxo-dGTP diphosphatase